MKKVLALVLSLMLLMIFVVGCQKPAEQPATEQPAATEEQKPAEEPGAMATPAEQPGSMEQQPAAEQPAQRESASSVFPVV